MYYSSANCKVYIDNNPVDELYGLEVSREHNFLPVYGYNKRNWSFLAEGKILLTGSLILNIKEADYLIKLINGKVNSEPAFSDKEITASLNYLRSLAQNSTDILEVARINTQNLVKNSSSSINSIETNNNIISNTLSSISIVNNVNDNVDVVTGVKFTGKSFAVNAGSSQNTKYAFPFVAKDSTI